MATQTSHILRMAEIEQGYIDAEAAADARLELRDARKRIELLTAQDRASVAIIRQMQAALAAKQTELAHVNTHLNNACGALTDANLKSDVLMVCVTDRDQLIASLRRELDAARTEAAETHNALTATNKHITEMEWKLAEANELLEDNYKHIAALTAELEEARVDASNAAGELREARLYLMAGA